MATAEVQKPLRARPVWTQAGSAILCWEAAIHCQPNQMRRGSQSQAAILLLNNHVASGGSETTALLRANNEAIC